MAKRKNEIVVKEKVFTNLSCGKSVKAWFKAADGMSKSTWAAAKAAYDIIALESWKDDFANQKELAEFLGSSQSQVSKMYRAYDYYSKAADGNGDSTIMLLDGFTLAAVTALLKVDLCHLKDFMSTYNVTRETSSRDIAKFADEYYADVESEESEESEEIEEVEAETVKDSPTDETVKDSPTDETDEITTDSVFNALVVIEMKVNEVAESGDLTPNDIERMEKALNDLKILLI